MRTTVTLDEDVARMLADQSRKCNQSFKETLNRAVRLGLGKAVSHEGQKAFRVEATPMGLRNGIDPAHLNALAGELEVAEFLDKPKPTRKSRR